jgi:hypothetical protein
VRAGIVRREPNGFFGGFARLTDFRLVRQDVREQGMVHRNVRLLRNRIANRQQRAILAAVLMELANGKMVQEESVVRIGLQRFAEFSLGLGVAALLQQNMAVMHQATDVRMIAHRRIPR